VWNELLARHVNAIQIGVNDVFELFIVDTDGLKQPIRVTFTDGFDGLPTFSPDGRRLAWTSGRGSGDGAQLWIARWNHAAAREALEQAPPRHERTP